MARAALSRGLSHPSGIAPVPARPDRGATSAPDRESGQWVRQLRTDHPQHDWAVAHLHEILLRFAIHELARRRGQLPSITGPEFDDIAQQAANDALLGILRRLDDFQGWSRFTTWAYKFAMLEVSTKVARHAWGRQPPSVGEFAWEQLPDWTASRPADRMDQHEQLTALSGAIGTLTDRQREVFVAIALNEKPIDAVATQLGSNPNAIYKNLFDARRKLRISLAAAGHPVAASDELQ